MEEKIRDFFEKSLTENQIDNELYTTYSVKKGLRNEDGTGQKFLMLSDIKKKMGKRLMTMVVFIIVELMSEILSKRSVMKRDISLKKFVF